MARIPGDQPLPLNDEDTNPEPPAERQREGWARLEHHARDRERAIADGEMR